MYSSLFPLVCCVALRGAAWFDLLKRPFGLSWDAQVGNKGRNNRSDGAGAAAAVGKTPTIAIMAVRRLKHASRSLRMPWPWRSEGG